MRIKSASLLYLYLSETLHTFTSSGIHTKKANKLFHAGPFHITFLQAIRSKGSLSLTFFSVHTNERLTDSLIPAVKWCEEAGRRPDDGNMSERRAADAAKHRLSSSVCASGQEGWETLSKASKSPPPHRTVIHGHHGVGRGGQQKIKETHWPSPQWRLTPTPSRHVRLHL